MRAPRESAVYGCPSSFCRVATFVSATALAKCPSCDQVGELLRFPLTDADAIERTRAEIRHRFDVSSGAPA